VPVTSQSVKVLARQKWEIEKTTVVEELHSGNGKQGKNSIDALIKRKKKGKRKGEMRLSH